MKKLLFILMFLCSLPSFAQTELEQTAMNNLLIISNRGNFPKNGTNIKQHRFDDNEWVLADLSINNLKDKAVVLLTYKANNVFGEIVPAESPSQRRLLAYDSPKNDFYEIYDVSVSKEDMTKLFFDTEKSYGMDHEYLIMLPDTTATVVAFFNKDGNKVSEHPISVDENIKITLYGKESITYDTENRIVKFTAPTYEEPVLDWIWENGYISKVRLKQFTTIWEKEIIILEKYDNGLWKKAKILEYQGSTKNDVRNMTGTFYLERLIVNIDDL